MIIIITRAQNNTIIKTKKKKNQSKQWEINVKIPAFYSIIVLKPV